MYAAVMIVMCTYAVTFSQVTAISHTCTWRGNYWSLQPNGRGECSPCSECPVGKFMRARCTKNADTRCERCRHGYFSLGGFKKKCKLCHKPLCQKGFRYVGCRRYRNAECVPCKKNYFYVEATDQCKRCNMCQPGHYVSSPCGIDHDTVCKPCPEGTFLESSSLQLYCRACRFCSLGEQTTRTCTADHNTECGSCSTGYFRLQSSHECAKCSVCYREYPGYTIEVDECRNKENDSDTICMPVAYPPYGYSNGYEYDYEMVTPRSMSIPRTNDIDDILIAVCVIVGVIGAVLIGISISVGIFYIGKWRRRKEKTSKIVMTQGHKVEDWISKHNDGESAQMITYSSEPSIWNHGNDKLKRNSYPTVLSVAKGFESEHLSSPLQLIAFENEEDEEFNMISVSHDDLPSANTNVMTSDVSCDHVTDTNVTIVAREEPRGASETEPVYTVEKHQTSDDDVVLLLPEENTYLMFNDQMFVPEHSSGYDGFAPNLSPRTTAVDVQSSSLRELSTGTAAIQLVSPLPSQTCDDLIDLESDIGGPSTVYSRNQHDEFNANTSPTFHQSAVSPRSNRDTILLERGERRKCYSMECHRPDNIVPQATDRRGLYYSDSQVDSCSERSPCPNMFAANMREEKSSCKCADCCAIQSL